MKIRIDEKFKSLIPPLAADELLQLEKNIIADGCREPLTIWGDILIDGHNRFAICEKHGIPFGTFALSFDNREAAEDWIDRNQLGRRNLAPDQWNLIMGRVYNREKKTKSDNLKQNSPKYQNDTSDGSEKTLTPDQISLERGKIYNRQKQTTAEKVGKDFGVSQITVKRAGKFADAVEEIKKFDPDIEKKIIAKQAPPKAAIVKAAELLETHPEKATSILTGEKKAADVIREIKKETVIEKLENIETKKAKAVEGVFDVIVIDPPWKMEKIGRDCRENQTDFDYPTMTPEELTRMKIPAADSCHIWVWATHKHLPLAIDLIGRWGLKYVCTFVWHKPGGFQPFGLPQYNCEFALYCRKGSPEFTDLKAFNLCFNAPRGKHSEKPEEFYDMVRRVTAGRRLDMFNRRVIDGFETWGKEAK